MISDRWTPFTSIRSLGFYYPPYEDIKLNKALMNMNKNKPSLFSMMGNRLYDCKIVNKYYKRPSKFESAISKIRLKQMFKKLEQLADEYIVNTVECFKQ